MKLACVVATLSIVAASFSVRARETFARPVVPAGVDRSAACPTDDPRARRVVNRFLTHPGLAPFRNEVGVTAVDTASVRVLTDSTDLAVCQKFVGEITLPADRPRDWAFYEAHGFYLVATVTAGGPTLRSSPLIIYDSTLALRKVLGM